MLRLGAIRRRLSAASQWPIDTSSGIGLLSDSAGGAAVALALLEASVPVCAAVFVDAIGDAEAGEYLTIADELVGRGDEGDEGSTVWASRMTEQVRAALATATPDEVVQALATPTAPITHETILCTLNQLHHEPPTE